LLDQLAALGGIGVAAGGLVALLISEQTSLFGFMEHGYRFAIVLAIASDVVAIAMLVLFVLRARTAPRGLRAAPGHARPDAPPTRASINHPPGAPAAES
jgi:hypothetical protein